MFDIQRLFIWQNYYFYRNSYNALLLTLPLLPENPTYKIRFPSLAQTKLFDIIGMWELKDEFPETQFNPYIHLLQI